ncbi:replicase-associated polyprotein [Citrus sudden death-associated virus]|uniref:Replicase-associated polyprotein n=4 Tax=Citrus sudden death-associated virus TaxID=312008 RepID=Q5EGG5_9VIRU|nr:replicase-associated polyprotein [Citrus sudden death-associated virus]AAW88343.1 replicase-associated polyprotein [Citrus sudden death-associated virus]
MDRISARIPVAPASAGPTEYTPYPHTHPLLPRGVFTSGPIQPCLHFLPHHAQDAPIRCYRPLTFANHLRYDRSASSLKTPPVKLPLTGGTLADAILSLAPTTHRDTIATPLMEALAEPYRQSLSTYPWHIPTNLQPFLTSCGITTAGQGFKAHPHPVHKTIETNLLTNVWPHYATTPSGVMFMKPSKFEKLKIKQPNFSKLYNYRITAKDTTRYPSTSPDLPTEDTCFMHDALMYYSPGQICDLFLSRPSLQKLYASLVVPPESDFTTISLFPDLYRYRIEKDQLIYELEQNPAHNYIQPRSAIDWLKTTTIRCQDLTLTISRLDSWGPVHSLLIQRGKPPIHLEEDSISFRAPKAVLLPEPASLSQSVRDRLVPADVYQALFIYVRAVRTLRVTDPAGFVRTQISKPEYSWVTSSAWDNLAHFALATAPHRPHTTYFLFNSTAARVAHWFRTHTLAPLSGATAAAASLLMTASWGFRAMISSHLVSLSICKRWLKAPPHLLWPEKAPWFQLTLRPKVTGPLIDLPILRPFRLFPSTCAKLGAKHPALATLLPAAPRPTWPLKVGLALAAVPVCLFLWRKFIGPDSPQDMHDSYHAMFHPQPWGLTLTRKAICCDRAPFLPIPVVPSSDFKAPPTPATPLLTSIPIKGVEPQVSGEGVPPQSASSTGPASDSRRAPQPASSTGPDPPTQNTSAAPQPPIESKVTFAQPIESVAPVVPGAGEPPQSASSTGPASVSRRDPQVASSTTPDAPTLDVSVTPPKTIYPIDHLQNDFGPCRCSVCEPLQPAPVPSTPLTVSDHKEAQDAEALSSALQALGLAPTPPAPQSQNLTVESSGAMHASSWDQLSSPSSDWDPSPLARDSSASGPPGMYSDLFPAPYLPGTGQFIFRSRANGRANIPYPDMDCLLLSIEQATRLPKEALWDTLCATCPDSLLDPDTIRRVGLSTDHFAILAHHYSLRCRFHTAHGVIELGMADATSSFDIDHTAGNPGHFSLRQSATPRLNGGIAQDLAVAALRFNIDGTLLPIRSVHVYSTWPKRAKNLSSNMKNGFDGIMANIHPTKTNESREKILALDSQLDIAVRRSVRLIHIAGFPGCGKSFPISRLLRTPTFRNFKVAVPTVELRAEWKTITGLPASEAWRIGTWESSLLKSARVLVIDEIYKMPRGYIDLAIHSDPTIEMVIALGDPLQGEYHSTHPSSTNSRLLSEPQHLSMYLDFYCLWSHRVPQNVAAFFHVKTTSKQPGFCRYQRELPNSRILANSQNAGHTLQQCGYAAVTIASSQGSTYENAACIHLDRNSSLLSPAHSMVALTRSKVGVIFTGDPAQLSNAPSSNRMFSEFFSGRTRPLHDWFHNEFPKATVLTEPLKTRGPRLTGAASPYSKAVPIRQASTPALKPDFQGDVIISAPIVLGSGELNAPQVSSHFLPETRRPLHWDIPSAIPESATRPDSTEPTTSHPEPVYPGETFENLAAHFLPAHDPTDREIYWQGQLSNQFPHMDKEFHLAAQPMSLLAAVHQEKQDPTLLPASIQKRLRFRPSDKPYQITPKDEILGQLLFEGLCRAYHRSPFHTEAFDPVLFAECINLNEFAQLSSKTQATIMGNARRSDPDWRWSAVRIFSKTQHKVNEGSIFRSWKACQTLALMHDAVVLILGPVKKYQRVFDQRDRPRHLYIHAGNTPSQMSNWCQQHLTTAVKLANDYTAFDQSQHGEAVVLERKKMERLSIPQALIDLHIHLKTHVSTQFGPLTCMRLTGEPGTYDDNSDYNLAVVNCEYMAANTPTMVSGDDSLLDREPPTRPEWVILQPLLSLRFKKERGRYATFCGYYASHVGCVRSPVALFAKLAIAVDDGSISDKMASYLSEFALGHSLGDHLWEALPLEAVPFQSACFDFFCRRAPRHLKLSLMLGEVPESIIARIGSSLKWASHAIYTTLSSAARVAILRSSRNSRSMPDDPDTTLLQGELLQHFQVPFMQSDTLLPLTGGSSAPILTPEAFSTSLAFSMASDAQAGPAPSRDDRVDRQPRLPAAPRVAEVGLNAPSVDYPFQWVVASYDGSEAKNLSDDLSGSATLTKVMANYRHAELTSVELEVCPLAAAFSKPISVSAVWTIASISPASASETSYYGGRLFTVGGPVLMSSTTHLPADLTRLNPVLKGPVKYTDCPRFSYSVYSNGGTKGTNLCTIILRGVVRLSGPSGNLLA